MHPTETAGFPFHLLNPPHQLLRLRTARKLWNVTERHETVTADCYSYTLGPDLLVVMTNRGSNLGNATKTCSVKIPEGSQLMLKGIINLQDVLDSTQVGSWLVGSWLVVGW